MDDDLLLASLLGRAPAPPAGGAPGLRMRIAPASSTGYAEADYAIALRNDGPAPVALLLSADDRGRLLSYELGAERLSLAPGQTAHVPLTVEAPRRLLGPDEPIAFAVYAEPEGAPALAAEARFVRRALLPGRAALLLVALLLALLAAPLVGRLAGRAAAPAQPAAIPTPAPGAPLVAAFAASPATVAPGEAVTIYWDVRGAERVTLEPFGPVPPLGQREHRPAQSEELRLVARAGAKETVAVLRLVVEP
jgi:hypothetical protein